MLNKQIFNKYFWDNTQEASDSFKIKRLFEYSSFPDLLKVPFSLIRNNINLVDIEKLRTSEKRKRFLFLVRNNLNKNKDWKGLIKTLIS